MTAMSDTLEQIVLDLTLRGTAHGLTYTSGVSVALHTGDPGEAGTANEVTGGTYTRKVATFNAASGGSASNAAQIEWPADEITAGTVITHVSIWDQSATPKCLYKGALSASQTVNAGAPVQIAAGALTVSLN